MKEEIRPGWFFCTWQFFFIKPTHTLDTGNEKRGVIKQKIIKNWKIIYRYDKPCPKPVRGYLRIWTHDDCDMPSPLVIIWTPLTWSLWPLLLPHLMPGSVYLGYYMGCFLFFSSRLPAHTDLPYSLWVRGCLRVLVRLASVISQTVCLALFYRFQSD